MGGLESMTPNHVYGKLFYVYTVMTTGTVLALHDRDLCLLLMSWVASYFSSLYSIMPQEVTLVIPKNSSAPEEDKAHQNNGSVSFSPSKSWALLKTAHIHNNSYKLVPSFCILLLQAKGTRHGEYQSFIIDVSVLQFPDFCSQLNRKTFILRILALQSNQSSSFQHSSQSLEQAQAVYGAENIKVRRKKYVDFEVLCFPQGKQEGIRPVSG